jgi:ribosome modulation factor
MTTLCFPTTPRGAGRLAGREGRTVEACPYPWHGAEAGEWLAGWSEAMGNPTDWRGWAERLLQEVDSLRDVLVQIRDRAPPEISDMAARALPGGR